MAEQQVYRYAPNLLARRYSAFAELEDNPIYLRETGQKYRKKNQLLEVAKGIALFILIFILFAFGLSCCPVVFPVVLVFIHNLTTSKLGDSLFARLTAEWEAGQLEQLALSSLSGREIIWGFACATMRKRFRFWMPIIFILGVSSLMIYIVLEFTDPLKRQSPDEFYLLLFMNIGIYLTAAMAFIFLGMMFLFMSSCVSTGRCFEMLGLSITERIWMFFGALFRDTLTCFGLLIPGAAISGIFLTVLAFTYFGIEYYAFDERSFSEDLMEGVITFLSFGIFFLFTIPLVWLATSKAYEVSMAQADRDFALAIQRLEERREEAAGSSIFGE